MRHSKWRAHQGGYDVFEDAHRVDLGNDMPVPSLAPSSPIGVSSVTVGRRPSAGLRYVCRSSLPVGTVLPTTTASRTAGGALRETLSSVTRQLPAAVVGGLVGWGLCSLLSRRKR